MITEIMDDLMHVAEMQNINVEYIELGIKQMEELNQIMRSHADEPIVGIELKSYKGIRLVYNQSISNLIRIKYEEN